MVNEHHVHPRRLLRRKWRYPRRPVRNHPPLHLLLFRLLMLVEKIKEDGEQWRDTNPACKQDDVLELRGLNLQSAEESEMRMERSRIADFTAFFCRRRSLSSVFSAYFRPSLLSTASDTLPNVPSPRHEAS